MHDGEAMRAALKNIKELCRKSLVERYKAKKAPPAEAMAMDEEEGEAPAEVVEEVEEMAEEEPVAAEKTELIVMSGKRKPEKLADELLPPAPKKRGRPPKKKL
jgi:molybdopterin-guanine dinucleotide biosynthesis protein